MKDLEQFSEEMLMDMQKHVTAGMTLGHADALLIRQAIDIALAAKQAKPVVDIEPLATAIMKTIDVETEKFHSAYTLSELRIAIVKTLSALTTPQPAHTEQSEMLNKGHSLSESIGELRKQIDSSGGYDFEALRSEQVNSPVIPDGWKLVPIEPNDYWAEQYCELTNKDPDGEQSTFICDGVVTTTFREKSKREIAAMLAAAPLATTPKPESE